MDIGDRFLNILNDNAGNFKNDEAFAICRLVI